jgi:hypothetical protein
LFNSKRTSLLDRVVNQLAFKVGSECQQHGVQRMEEAGKLSHLISLECHRSLTVKWRWEVLLYDSDGACGLLAQRAC